MAPVETCLVAVEVEAEGSNAKQPQCCGVLADLSGWGLMNGSASRGIWQQLCCPPVYIEGIAEAMGPHVDPGIVPLWPLALLHQRPHSIGDAVEIPAVVQGELHLDLNHQTKASQLIKI